MSKKILFTASTMSHLEHFHRPYLNAFEQMGYEVTALALPVSKSFFSIQNIRAIFNLRKMLRKEKYDIISSHATLAGVVTRLALLLADARNRNVKVFHTAHGYLFHDDHSLKKWAYILPEMLCATVTDVLMVMNHEDLEIARKYRLGGRKNKIYYIDGMGVDLSRFHPRQGNAEEKEALGIKENDFTFVYVGEFSKRKNHRLLLNGFAQALKQVEDKQTVENTQLGSDECHTTEYVRWKLALAGDGALLEEMKVLANDLGLSDQVLFLGYIRNVQELYNCCQAAVTTSRIEGLPFNVMEAMGCGLPIVASDIKGHKELVTHGENGLLFKSDNQDELANQLIRIYTEAEFRNHCKEFSLEKIKMFSIENVFPVIMKVYKDNI